MLRPERPRQVEPRRGNHGARKNDVTDAKRVIKEQTADDRADIKQARALRKLAHARLAETGKA